MGVEYGYQNTFSPPQRSGCLNKDEIAILRKRAWLEQGILIVPCIDQALSSGEKVLLCKIAKRLYGTPEEN